MMYDDGITQGYEGPRDDFEVLPVVHGTQRMEIQLKLINLCQVLGRSCDACSIVLLYYAIVRGEETDLGDPKSIIRK